MKIVEVTWHDASSPTFRTWYSSEDMERVNANPDCTHIGFVYAETDTYITIVSGVMGEGEDWQMVSSPFTIPKGCIKKIRRLK